MLEKLFRQQGDIQRLLPDAGLHTGSTDSNDTQN